MQAKKDGDCLAIAIDSKGPSGPFERDTNIPAVYTPFIVVVIKVIRSMILVPFSVIAS